MCTCVCPYRGNLKWSGLTLARYFGEPGSTLYGAFDLCCVCAGRPPLLPDDQPLRHHPLHLYLSFVNRRRENLVASLEIPNPVWHYGCNWHQTNTMLHCNTSLVSIFMASRIITDTENEIRKKSVWPHPYEQFHFMNCGIAASFLRIGCADTARTSEELC